MFTECINYNLQLLVRVNGVGICDGKFLPFSSTKSLGRVRRFEVNLFFDRVLATRYPFYSILFSKSD